MTVIQRVCCCEEPACTLGETIAVTFAGVDAAKCQGCLLKNYWDFPVRTVGQGVDGTHVLNLTEENPVLCVYSGSISQNPVKKMGADVYTFEDCITLRGRAVFTVVIKVFIIKATQKVQFVSVSSDIFSELTGFLALHGHQQDWSLFSSDFPIESELGDELVNVNDCADNLVPNVIQEAIWSNGGTAIVTEIGI